MVALIAFCILVDEGGWIFNRFTDVTKKPLLKLHDAFFFKALNPLEDTLFTIFRRNKV